MEAGREVRRGRSKERVERGRKGRKESQRE